MFLLLSAALAGPVDTIRAEWKAFEAAIATGGVPSLTVDWNATDTSWPAVGTYDLALTAWCVAEGERPYPDTVRKIRTARQNGARSESHTFLYDASGALRFAMAEAPQTPALRAYWDAGEVVRVQVGEKVSSTVADPRIARLRAEGEQVFRVASGLVAKPPSVLVLEE